MARLVYGTGVNAVDLWPWVRTMGYSIETVRDRMAGLDEMYHRITIEVEGIINPFAFSTNMVQRFGGARQPLVEGDRAGIALANLRTLLQRDRQRLVFQVGNDNAIISPLTDPATGLPLSSDCDGGPKAGKFITLQVIGDKSIPFRWSVSTTFNSGTRFLLSNRWTQSAQIDTHGYTTKTTSGRAEFRLDYLNRIGLSPDMWRRFLVVPCPSDMRRTAVRVVAQADGAAVQYDVTDREYTYPTGNGITLIEGNATVGVEYPVRSVKTAMERAGRAARDAAMSVGAGPMGLLGWLFREAQNAPANIWANLVPDPKANAICRVHAQKGTDMGSMARVAIRIILDNLGGPDRIFSPGFNAVFDDLSKFPVSMYVTKGLGSEDHPWVECRGEFLLLNLNMLRTICRPGAWPNEMLNLKYPTAAELTAQGLGGLAGPPTRLPLSNNTRGTWIGDIVAQVLKDGMTDLPLQQTPAVYSEVADNG